MAIVAHILAMIYWILIVLLSVVLLVIHPPLLKPLGSMVVPFLASGFLLTIGLSREIELYHGSKSSHVFPSGSYVRVKGEEGYYVVHQHDGGVCHYLVKMPLLPKVSYTSEPFATFRLKSYKPKVKWI